MRTSDGFTFPVDVRVEYVIEPGQRARWWSRSSATTRRTWSRPLNSSVRAIFRNNAESVKALDYVQQRSQQESQSLAMLQAEMAGRGVTITAVRIGDVGTDDTDLQPLLKTQTDREIALQEQLTFQEQQRAAEQKKMLTRTEQEAEEERRLATASYQVQDRRAGEGAAPHRGCRGGRGDPHRGRRAIRGVPTRRQRDRFRKRGARRAPEDHRRARHRDHATGDGGRRSRRGCRTERRDRRAHRHHARRDGGQAGDEFGRQGRRAEQAVSSEEKSRGGDGLRSRLPQQARRFALRVHPVHVTAARAKRATTV